MTTPLADTPPGQTPPLQTARPLGRHPPHSACWDMVNKRAVHIPLECILVKYIYYENRIYLIVQVQVVNTIEVVPGSVIIEKPCRDSY